MAECDLLAPEGYQESVLGPLSVRVAAVHAPAHPLGPEYTEPHYGVFGCSKRLPTCGWICLGVPVLDGDAMLATIDEGGQERAEVLSLTIGVSWKAIALSARGAVLAQEEAVSALPPHVYGATPKELATVRQLINDSDPKRVATLLAMSYFWATDAGGTRGPRDL